MDGMGPITTDESGNTYIAPVPTVNVLDNPLDQQNIIYKVESSSGEMKPFINLMEKNFPNNRQYPMVYSACIMNVTTNVIMQVQLPDLLWKRKEEE
jgi:hypothetical protein